MNPEMANIPDTFMFEGISYKPIDSMLNWWARCLALPINSPGAPRWFSNEQMHLINLQSLPKE